MVFVPTGATVGTLAEASATVGRLRTFSTSSRVRVLAERAASGPSPCASGFPGLMRSRLDPMPVSLPVIASCTPLPRDVSKMTAKTPITIPSMLRALRPRLTISPERPIPAILSIFPISHHLRWLVGDDPPVAELHYSLRPRGDLRVVRDDHDRDPRSVQFLKQVEDLGAGDRVQVSGWLVGQQQGGAVDQRPGDSYPLHLPAGELGRAVVRPLGEADRLQNPESPLTSLLPAHACVDHRKLHVLERALSGKEVVALEDEPDEIPAGARQLTVPQPRHVAPVERVGPGRRPVQKAEEVHQGALSAPGRPHYGDPLARLDVHVHPGQCLHPVLPPTVYLREFSGFYHPHSQLLSEDLSWFEFMTGPARSVISPGCSALLGTSLNVPTSRGW